MTTNARRQVIKTLAFAAGKQAMLVPEEEGLRDIRIVEAI
jgi:hypothetical protein